MPFIDEQDSPLIVLCETTEPTVEALEAKRVPIATGHAAAAESLSALEHLGH
jgi:hypothetical protein